MGSPQPFAGFDPDETPLHHTTGRRGRESTHCKRGHAFTPQNTYWCTIRGYRTRRCKQCLAAQSNRLYRENEAFREAKKAAGRRYWHRKRKHDLAARSIKEPK